MYTKPLILVVEDNPDVRKLVTSNLTGEGYDVASVETAAELYKKIPGIDPDAILLDIVLPDGDGLHLIKDIKKYTDAPIIVISAKTDLIHKIVGLEMGADDYVGKPLQMKELNARVKAQLRRYNSHKDNNGINRLKKRSAALKIKFGSWILNREKFQVFDEDGHPANLTIKEFRLLETLVVDADKIFSREQLLDKARPGAYNTTDRAIDVRILRIRKKLGDTNNPPEIIKAVRGVGYVLIAKTDILE